MTTTVTTTVERITVVIGPQIQQQLRLAAREAVNASARAVATEATTALKAVLGPEQKMSGLGPRAQRIRVQVSPAKSETKPVAVVRPKGQGWWLIERPRAGGYDIVPKHPGTVLRDGSLIEMFEQSLSESAAATGRRTRQALKEVYPPALGFGPYPGGPFRAKVKGGAITTPRAPITKTFARAQQIVAAHAKVVFDKRMERRYG